MNGKLQAIIWLVTASAAYLDLWMVMRLIAGSVRYRRVIDLPALAIGVFPAMWVFRLFPAGDDALPLPIRLGAALLIGAVWCGAQLRFQAKSVSNWQDAKRSREDSRQSILHLVLLTGSLVFVFPFLWLVSTSFKVEEKMFTQPPELLPRRYLSASLEGGIHRLATVPMNGKPAVVALFTAAGDQMQVRPLVATGRTMLVSPSQIDYQGDLRVAVHGHLFPLALITIPNKELGDQKLTAVIEDESVQIPNHPNKARLVEGSYQACLVEAAPKGQMVAAASVVPLQQVHMEWANYPKALEFLPQEVGHGLVFLRNTLYLCLMNILGTVLSSSLVAYAFARLRWPGRDLLFVVLLATMMLPGAVTMIPVFLIFRSLGWIDTLRPLWFPAFFGGAFNIFLLRQFFMTIPHDLEDAAKIDGCSYFAIYWRIMLPLVKPALATITIFAFMGAWNNFMGPLIYVSSPDQMPLAYALQLFQSAHGSEYGLQMAASTLVVLPVLAVFFFTQRYFIQGITLTGIKG